MRARDLAPRDLVLVVVQPCHQRRATKKAHIHASCVTDTRFGSSTYHTYLNFAISLRGPPMPHPTSNTCERLSGETACSYRFSIGKIAGFNCVLILLTFMPSVRPSCKAKKCSYRLMLSRRVSPSHLKT
jgi:hypothetical protein